MELHLSVCSAVVLRRLCRSQIVGAGISDDVAAFVFWSPFNWRITMADVGLDPLFTGT